MTGRPASGPHLRDLAPGEPQLLGELLDDAFSGYRDTTRFSKPVLRFLDRWAWSEHPLSVGIETGSGLVAVGLGTLREARWQGKTLRAVHLGPIGVRPGYRRRGLGSRLLRALADRAEALDADLLTLTTEVVYGAWRLYGRHDYRILETYRPIVRPLFPGMPDAIGPPSTVPVEAVDAAVFADVYRPGPGRSGAVVETWRGEPEPPSVQRPRLLLAGNAAISTLRWPVMSRSHDERVQVWATQILRVQGDGPERAAVLAEASRGARLDGSVCIYALPSAAERLPGFSNRGAPLVHRMVRPLTALGEAVAAGATGWDEICPAP